MNIFRKYTWRAMWQNRARTVVTLLGVILSAAMFTAVTTMAVSLWQFLVDAETYESGRHFVSWDVAGEETGELLREEKEIKTLGDYRALGYVSLEGNQFRNGVLAAADPGFFRLISLHPTRGRLPENGREIILSDLSAMKLEQQGKGHEVGDTVEIEVFRDYWEAEGDTLPRGSWSGKKTFTIVGITDQFFSWGARELYLTGYLTCAEENQPAPAWHCYYADTYIPGRAYDLAEEIPGGETNDSLLNFYGAGRIGNLNRVLLNFSLVFIAIILLGSVSLIYNAFSISVSQRTREFGLLASLGATRRQVRRSVFFEAGALSVLGIPLGLLSGWGGIAVTLALLGPRIQESLMGAVRGHLELRAVVSLPALLAAALIALVTVFVSALIPARRATRITPMEAITQREDYKVPARGIRVRPLTYKLWGFPGAMSRKYYAVSRKKYRATVISLAVSLFLFVTASAFSSSFRELARGAANIENFDFSVYELTPEEEQELRAHPGVTRAVRTGVDAGLYYGQTPREDVSPAYGAYLQERWRQEPGENYALPIRFYYLQEDAFLALLKEEKVKPEPYLRGEILLGLQPVITEYGADAQTGEISKEKTAYEPLRPGEGELSLLRGLPPETLPEILPGNYSSSFYTEEGRVYMELIPYIEEEGGGYDDWEHPVTFLVTLEEGVQNYYLLTEGVPGTEPAMTLPAQEGQRSLRVGAWIRDLPFGLPEGARDDTMGQCLSFLLPESMAPAERYRYMPELNISVEDYEGVKAWLTEKDLPYTDLLREEMSSRNVVRIVNVFAYGFILLISLICLCNVVNTVSTNVALRRRDFAMLRSVGMKSRELYRMMHFECLRYGVRAFLGGIPLSLLSSYGIWRLYAEVLDRGFRPPWEAILTGSLLVFLVVFLTMAYGVTRLRRDNPIEALRMDQ